MTVLIERMMVQAREAERAYRGVNPEMQLKMVALIHKLAQLWPEMEQRYGNGHIPPQLLGIQS
jgi:hypothetical protein